MAQELIQEKELIQDFSTQPGAVEVEDKDVEHAYKSGYLAGHHDGINSANSGASIRSRTPNAPIPRTTTASGDPSGH